MSFGSFGSFGSMGSSLSSDTISIEYFSGQPNPQLLPSELVSVVKNLMRKDVTTRERGAKELLKLLPSLEIDEVVHLAWVQLYVKLCFDDAASVRAAAHKILGEIYAKLGKASTKYLKHSLPCLFCGFYDQVADVQQAAKSTFEALFSAEKRPLVLQKFSPDILDMCSNIVLVQTPATLSDERYVSKQESALKYERALRQALDVLSYTLLDELSDIPLLYESKLWKLMAVEPVAKNVLNLATKVVKRDNALDELVEKQLNKALQKPVPSASVELVRALLVYHKNGQKVSVNALAGYLKGAALFPKPFWPLFFNLAILIGFESPLKEALAAVALKVAGLTKEEVWGAFLALCGRSNNEKLAADTVFARCKQGKVDVAERFAKLSPAREHVAELISGEGTPQKLNFMLVLAATHLYKSQIEAVIASYSLDQVAQLVRAEPELDLSSVELTGGDPHVLATIASYSKTVDAKAIAANLPDDVLLEHPLLGERGVSVELGDLSEPQELLKGALSRALVGDKQAAVYVQRLADQSCFEELTEIARKQPAFLQSALNSESGTALLNNLEGHDELANVLRGNDTAAAILKDLKGDTPIDALLDRAVALCADGALPELLPELKLMWPADYSVYPVPWAGESASSTEWESTLREAVFAVNLARLVDFEATTLQKISLDLTLVAKACASIEFVSTDEHTTALAGALAEDAQQLEVNEESLWAAIKGNTPRAFYAAQILYELCKGRDNSDVPAKFRNTQPPALVWALVAQLGAGKDAHWYVREQQTLRQRASTLNEFACLDPRAQGFDAVLKRLSSAEEPLFQWVLKAQLAKGEDLLPDLVSHALGSSAHSQRQVLGQIAPHEYDQAVAEAALALTPTANEQFNTTESAFLGYCRQLLSTDTGVSPGSLETWLHYCLARQHALKEYAANGTIPSIEGLPAWMLYIDIVGEAQRRQLQSSKKQVPLSTVFSDFTGVNDAVLAHIQQHINSVTSFTLEEAVGTDAASYLLLNMCQYFGGAVRQWYRSITDKTLRAQVEAALQRVVPEIMKQVAQEANLDSTTVSQKAREIRTMLEIDESVAQIVITLDPLFPVKNASVQLIDLAGVPEHKKRSWALEAEYTVQSGQVVAAMRTLRLKVEQFLEGIEPCAICYSVMLGKSLPSKTCSTCKNTYHSDCLYQWFHSNKDKLCPMCRTPF